MDVPNNIHEISTWLDSEIRPGDPATVPLAVVQALSGDGNLLGLLKSLAETPKALRESARYSCRHDNGFDKILLADSPAGWRLRLNIWWPNRGIHTENIHNHRWDFVSTVLEGQFRSDYFTEDPDGDTYHAYKYRRDGDSSYRHHDVGTRRASLAMSGPVRRGQSYLLNRTLMHRIATDRSNLAATLMLHSPQRTESAVTLTQEPLFADSPAALPQLYDSSTLHGRVSKFVSSYQPW